MPSARRVFDGAMMGSPHGDRCHRIFEPRWYELGRWLRYLFAREKGRVTVHYDGRYVSLRTVGCPCINR